MQDAGKADMRAVEGQAEYAKRRETGKE